MDDNSYAALMSRWLKDDIARMSGAGISLPPEFELQPVRLYEDGRTHGHVNTVMSPKRTITISVSRSLVRDNWRKAVGVMCHEFLHGYFAATLKGRVHIPHLIEEAFCDAHAVVCAIQRYSAYPVREWKVVEEYRWLHLQMSLELLAVANPAEAVCLVLDNLKRCDGDLYSNSAFYMMEQVLISSKNVVVNPCHW